MQRDGRTLDHGTLETIRLMAVERVREGEAGFAFPIRYIPPLLSGSLSSDSKHCVHIRGFDSSLLGRI